MRRLQGIACQAPANRDGGAHLGLNFTLGIAIGEQAAGNQADEQNERRQQDELKPKGHALLPNSHSSGPADHRDNSGRGKARRPSDAVRRVHPRTAPGKAFREFFP